MNRKKLLRAVESTAFTAAEKGQAVIDEAVQFITPYVEQAADYVGPLAREARQKGVEFAVDAYDRVQPRLAEARKRGSELAADTYGRVQPHLDDARRRGARMAADTLDRIQPALDEALDRVTPAVADAVSRVQPIVDEAISRIAPTVDVARDKVQHDLLPRLSAALHEAAAAALATQAAEQIAAAGLAVAAQPAPAKKKCRVGRVVAKIALVGAIAAGVAIIAKKLLGASESGWEAHEANAPYVADPVADVMDDLAESAAEADVAAEADEAAESAAEAAGQAEAEVADVTDADEDSAEGDAAPLALSPYGEGSYVGPTPPEGFEIKGNERSRKYHVQGTGGYERTITDVWFSSPQAAEQAGFVKAQR